MITWISDYRGIPLTDSAPWLITRSLWSQHQIITDIKFAHKVTINMKMAVFWVVSPCILVEIYQRFRGPCCLHHQGDETRPDDGSSKVLWNVGKFLPDYTALQPRRQPSSYQPPWEPQVLLTINIFAITSFSTRTLHKQSYFLIHRSHIHGRNGLKRKCFNSPYHGAEKYNTSIIQTHISE
jgi:hypothetical protein